MLKNLKFKHKIILLPSLATAAFLLILAVSQFLGVKNETLLTRIESGYAPALEMSRNLEETLGEIQRGMQDAAGAADAGLLSETDTLRDRFLKQLEGGRNIATTRIQDLDDMKNEFQAYYLLARETTQKLIRGKVEEETVAALNTMKTKYNKIRETLAANTDRDKKEMSAAFASARALQKTSMFANATVTLISVLLLGGLSVSVVRGIMKPLSEVSVSFTRMAAGDFKHEIEITSRDEMGALSKAFNEMSQKLRGLILQVREATLAVTDAAEKLQQTGDNISKEVHQQKSAVEETSSSISEMTASINEVNNNVELLSISANETSSSILQMDATLHEIARNMDQLSGGIEITSSSISEMTRSMKETAENVENLKNITEKTASSLHALNTSVKTVEENAQKSHALSEKSAQDAQKGMQSVHETTAGMQEIKVGFMELKEIISRLSEKSDSIGKVVKVIEEVTEQTTLLSLNAAIIAAQSGEHGKGFAVVADEIKSLAERTATSTREIAILIKAVQDETSNAVTAMLNGSERVEKGVLLSNEAVEALKMIIDSSSLSTGMVNDIVKATKSQATEIQEVDHSMVQMTKMVQQINQATHDQEKSSLEIIKAVEEMRILGRQVKRSTQEQGKGSKLITAAVEKVTVMIRHILGATQEQTGGSERIHHALLVFKEGTDKSARRAEEMNQVVAALSSRSKQLEQEIGRFKI
ncbi:MAG TPA: methyl-accepting chemotaxis protein [Candidatus Manganitrophaceae bacterium]|nr:methyl-accepting chemotaxis protein [Candidatus Manganitrophaceae bacterium]